MILTRFFAAVVTFFRVLFGGSGAARVTINVPYSGKTPTRQQITVIDVGDRRSGYRLAICNLDPASQCVAQPMPIGGRTFIDVTGMFGAIIRGQSGSIRTDNVSGYAASRGTLGIARTATLIYVYHLEHSSSSGNVDIKHAGQNVLHLTASGYYTFDLAGNVKSGPTPINGPLDLPAEINQVVNALSQA